MRKDYTDFYNRITAGIRKRPHGAQVLRTVDRVLTALMYAAYPIMLVTLLLEGYAGNAGFFSMAISRGVHFENGIFTGASSGSGNVPAGGQGALFPGGLRGAFEAVFPYILIPGISFVLVSLVRDRINWKRPYEEWPIDPLIHKETRGHSMPSRHVFSSAVIAMSVMSLNRWAGCILLIVTVLSAFVRVLGGVHYPRDVAAGFLIGCAAGILLLL